MHFNIQKNIMYKGFHSLKFPFNTKMIVLERLVIKYWYMVIILLFTDELLSFLNTVRDF